MSLIAVLHGYLWFLSPMKKDASSRLVHETRFLYAWEFMLYFRMIFHSTYYGISTAGGLYFITPDIVITPSFVLGAVIFFVLGLMRVRTIVPQFLFHSNIMSALLVTWELVRFGL